MVLGMDRREIAPGSMVIDDENRVGLVVGVYVSPAVKGQLEGSIFRWRWLIVFEHVLKEAWSLADYDLVIR